MSAADFGKPKMTFALLCYDSQMNVGGTTGALIHYVVSPRRKVRNEMQYILWLRYGLPSPGIPKLTVL